MPKYMHPSKKSRAIVIFSISASLLLHGIGIYFLFEHPFSLHSSHAIPFGSRKSYAHQEKNQNTEKLKTLRDAFNYIVAKNERNLPQHEVAIDPQKLVAPRGERLENANALDNTLQQLSVALDRKAKNTQLLLQGFSTEASQVALKEDLVKPLNVNALKPKSLLSLQQIKLARESGQKNSDSPEKTTTNLKPSLCATNLTAKTASVPSLTPASRPTHWAPLNVKSSTQIENNEVLASNLSPEKRHPSYKIDVEISIPDEIPERKSSRSEPNYRYLRNPEKEFAGNLMKPHKRLFTALPKPEKTADKAFTLYGNNTTQTAHAQRVAVGKKALNYSESLSLEQKSQLDMQAPTHDATIALHGPKQFEEKTNLPTPKQKNYRYLATTRVPSYTRHFTHNIPISVQYSTTQVEPQEKVPFAAEPKIAFSENMLIFNRSPDRDSLVANNDSRQSKTEAEMKELAVTCNAQEIETEPSYVSSCDTLEATWEPPIQTASSETVAVPKNSLEPQTDIPFEDEEPNIAISFSLDDPITATPVSAHKESYPLTISLSNAPQEISTAAKNSIVQQMVLEDFPMVHSAPTALDITPCKTRVKVGETSLLETVYEQNEVPAVAHLVSLDESTLSADASGHIQSVDIEDPQFTEPQFQVGIIPFSHFYGEHYPKPSHAAAPAVEVGQTDHTPSRSEAGDLNETHRFTKYNLVTLPNLSELDTVSLEGEFVAKVQVSTKRRDGIYFFSIELEPRNQKCLQPMNQNYTFIIDRSNGIEKNRLKTYCDGVARAIQQLKDDDSFNIIMVDSDVEKMSNHSIYKSDLSLRAAKRFLAQQQPGYRHSSPNLSALLLKIGKVAQTSPMHNTVFLLSNGKALDPFAPKDSHLKELIKEYKSFFTLFTATASHGNHNAHLQMMSKFFKGAHLHSQTNAAFPRKFAALVKKSGTAVAKNVKAFVATAPDGVDISFFPNNAHLPDVYTGRNIRLYGQTTNLCDFELLVQGQAGNEWVNIRQKIQLKDAVQSPVTFDRELLKSNGYDLFDRYLEENEISYLEQAREILAPEMGIL